MKQNGGGTTSIEVETMEILALDKLMAQLLSSAVLTVTPM